MLLSVLFYYDLPVFALQRKHVPAHTLKLGTEEQPETPEASQNAPGIAAHIMDAVAKNIDAQWRELAEKMGFTDTIQYIEGSLQSDLERARYVVQLWAEDDLDNSAEQLAKSLEDHGFPKAAAVVKQSL
uniref:Death domain-containing protein n=1 Tax=Homalodisca liturata TaxID=320908 RepID=A0A1B6JC55_9HEMI